MPPKCHNCKKFIKPVTDPGLCCAGCNKAYHRQCANLSQKELDELEKKQPKGVLWNCQICLTGKRRSSIFNTAQNNSITQAPTTTADQQELSTSQPSLNFRFEELLKEFKLLKTATEKEISDLKQEITQLKAKPPQSPAANQIPVDASSPQSVAVTATTPDHKIIDHHSHLEIRGLPADSPLSLIEAVTSVGVAIGCEVDSSDVTIISSQDKTAIDLKFNNLEKKRDFLLAGKAFNRRKGRLEIEQRQHKFFINEKLSEDKRHLLYNSKRVSSDNGYKFAWIVKGDIHIKRCEGEKSIVIYNERQLHELFPSRLLPECKPIENKNQPCSSSSHKQ